MTSTHTQSKSKGRGKQTEVVSDMAAVQVPTTTLNTSQIKVSTQVKSVVPPTPMPSPNPVPSAEQPVVPAMQPDLTATENTVPLVEGGENHTESSLKFDDVIKDVIERHKVLATGVRETYNLIKTLQKIHHQDCKQMKKKNKPSNRTSTRQVSGFAMPTRVPVECCKFLGIDENSVLPRTEVTKQLYAKIKSLGLTREENQREMVPNADLQKLFCMLPSETLEFKNFQRFLSRMYKAGLPPVVETPAPV